MADPAVDGRLPVLVEATQLVAQQVGTDNQICSSCSSLSSSGARRFRPLGSQVFRGGSELALVDVPAMFAESIIIRRVKPQTPARLAERSWNPGRIRDLTLRMAH